MFNYMFVMSAAFIVHTSCHAMHVEILGGLFLSQRGLSVVLEPTKELDPSVELNLRNKAMESSFEASI